MRQENASSRNILTACAILILAIFCSSGVWAQSQGIFHSVQVAPTLIDVGENETSRISWYQSQPGIIKVFICNLDGKIVKTLYESHASEFGTQQVVWDGRDELGNLCPNGVYLPIIKVSTDNRGTQVYNSTTAPWGADLSQSDVTYNAAAGKITYQLAQPALCLLRVGERDGGPVYITLSDWEPRVAGYHEKSWNGMDGGGLVWAADKEKLQIVLDAFSTPENAILITGSTNPSHKFEGIKKRFPLHPPFARKMMLHALHNREICHDFAIQVDIIRPERISNNIPVITGKAALLISIGSQVTQARLVREKFELYLFVDGAFISEGPRKTLPAQLMLDSNKLSNGEHIITVNLRTLEDHVGTTSLKVTVDN